MKKKKDDRNVENTNSDSLLSKLSVVSLGYRNDPFLQELCSHKGIKSRRSPAINRGYLARLLALEVTFEKLLMSGRFKQVLSLGAGFDSMYFRLKNMGIIGDDVKYFEVDYPESVVRKDARISKSQVLRSFFKQRKSIDNKVFIYDDGTLTLIGCNMVQLQTLEYLLNHAKFDKQSPTLILTECSTTYIEAEDCTRLLTMLTQFIDRFAFISYEQIRPFDDFGQIMLEHFQKRNSSLKCVEHYPTVEHHRQRFLAHGWDDVYIDTIEHLWKTHVGSTEMSRLNSVECFDEAPELMLKCLHYVLIMGTKNMKIPMDPCWSLKVDTITTCPISLSEVAGAEIDIYQRYGHSSWLKEDRLYICGGITASQTRIASLSCIDATNFQTILWTKQLPFDLLFSACATFKGDSFAYGGRGSPNQPHSRFIRFDYNGEFQELLSESRPSARWSHTLSGQEESDSIYLIGGRDLKCVHNDIFQYCVSKNTWKSVATLPTGLYSHSAVNYKSEIIIHGGLEDFSKCNVNKNILIFDPKAKTIKKVPRLPDHYFGRFAHTSHVTKNGLLLQVGGVVIAPQDIVLTTIDLMTMMVINYESKQRIRAPIVQHSSAIVNDEYILVFGGGTNCFSFGMHVNSSVIKMIYS